MAATGRRWTVPFSATLRGGLNAHGIGVAIPSYDLCPACHRRGDHPADADGDRVNWRGSGGPLVMSGHSAGGHLAACMLATDWPAFDASLPARSRHRGLRHFGPVRSDAAGRNLDQQGACISIEADGEGREPAVLEGAGAWKSRRGGRRKRKRGIFPAKPDHRRALGRGRHRDAVRRRSPAPTISPRLRRWPIRNRRWSRACGNWRRRLAGKKGAGWSGFGHLRQITLSIKCFAERCRPCLRLHRKRGAMEMSGGIPRALARRVTSMILRGEICRRQGNGRNCCSTGRSFSIPNISTPRSN